MRVRDNGGFTAADDKDKLCACLDARLNMVCDCVEAVTPGPEHQEQIIWMVFFLLTMPLQDRDDS